MPTYPSEWETHAVLKDGSTVELRPIKPDDRDALQRFHGQQSRESIYFRFFRYRPELPDSELDYFTKVDYQDRMAFVATLGRELVAVARYERLAERPVAEVAFFVHDDHHGKGLGTLMLEYLAAAARDRGLSGFTATVLPENYRMLGVFRSAGFDVSTRFDQGVIEVDLGIEVTTETSSAIAARQRRSTARSVARILEPRTVAVIGASRSPGTVGHELVRHLTESRRNEPGRGARVVAVNPNAEEIAGVASHPTIAAAADALADGGDADPGADGDREAGVDLAVIAVRADRVLDLVGQCAEAGVRGLLIISAGFSELDGRGRALEREVVDVARDNGMRLIGPAAFGLVNTDPDVDLSAVYHPVAVSRGRVALASQSGPLGAALLESLRSCGVGVSSFVGVGNRADVSVNDLIEYWTVDPNTDVIVLYVENFGNLRNFSTVARRTSALKPIVTIRPASADQTELLRQAGVILVDGVSQLVEQANMAALQPPARGNRVAIVSNTASLARLAVDACRRQGLDVLVPASVSGGSGDSVLIGDLDTVSLHPSGDPDAYERVVVAAAVSDEVDLILLALAPTTFLGIDRLSTLIDRINRSIDKPVVAIGLTAADAFEVEGIPIFTFPEEAAEVLGRHASYGLWRAARLDLTHLLGGEEAEATVVAADGDGGDPVAVDDQIDRILAGREEATLTLASPDLQPLVDALAVPLAPWGIADDLDDVVALADEIGYPVVLKAANLAHRSVGESGGAAIDLHDQEELMAAHRRMTEQLGVSMRTSVVQRMIASTGIVRLELFQDPAFGAMVAIGLGGSAYADVAPVARRFLPVDRASAGELVRTMIVEQTLADLDPAGGEALVALILRLVQAASAGDRLARISLNPILLAGPDTIPTDVEIVLRKRSPDPLAQVRHI